MADKIAGGDSRESGPLASLAEPRIAKPAATGCRGWARRSARNDVRRRKPSEVAAVSVGFPRGLSADRRGWAEVEQKIDLDWLLRVRVVVARCGEMDAQRWWNTEGGSLAPTAPGS